MAGIGGSGRQPGAYYESRLNHRDRSTRKLLEGMMSNLEQLQKDVEALPAEAQLLLMDFIEILKKRYPKNLQPEESAEQSLTHAVTKLAEPSFARVWDNPKDAIYDKL